jgi:hypothetical protein
MGVMKDREWLFILWPFPGLLLVTNFVVFKEYLDGKQNRNSVYSKAGG